MNRNAYHREYYKKNGHKRLEKKKEYMKNRRLNPDIRQKDSDYCLKYKYGLTREQVNALIAHQLGLCKICKKKKELVVDHDHSTGKVRGMLCYSCNHLLGCAYDSCAILADGIIYLEQNKE